MLEPAKAAAPAAGAWAEEPWGARDLAWGPLAVEWHQLSLYEKTDQQPSNIKTLRTKKT